MRRTQKLNLESQPLYQDIAKAAADVWNECLELMDVYQSQQLDSDKGCEGWMDKHLSKSQPLHSQSIQAVRKRYFQAWNSYHILNRNGSTDARPPNKTKKYFTNRWLKSAIRFTSSSMRLSMGAGRKALDIQLPDSFDMSDVEHVVTIDLVFANGRHCLHIGYRYPEEPTCAPGDGVLGVDLGEIHPMVTHDGQETLIFNGRYIRSLYRLRNKVNSQFQHLLSKCKCHSARTRKLIARKWKFLNRLDRQIHDALHKHTSKLRDICLQRGIGTVVIGTLKNIRGSMKYGRKANQKLHQWAFAKIVELLTYKLEAIGVRVVGCDESYTSQTCPQCGERRKPSNRNYRCRACGFTYHRDGVGAINIRRKYLGHSSLLLMSSLSTAQVAVGGAARLVPVAAAMTPPRGIRVIPRLPH